MADRCRIVEVDGEAIRIRGGRGPLTDRDREALEELVRAAKAHAARELTPEQLERQQAARERVRRLRGGL